MLNTDYIKLHDKKNNFIHTVAIRSDWEESDFDQVEKMFPGTIIKTFYQNHPVCLLHQVYYNLDNLILL